MWSAFMFRLLQFGFLSINAHILKVVKFINKRLTCRYGSVRIWIHSIAKVEMGTEKQLLSKLTAQIVSVAGLAQRSQKPFVVNISNQSFRIFTKIRRSLRENVCSLRSFRLTVCSLQRAYKQENETALNRSNNCIYMELDVTKYTHVRCENVAK